MAERLAFELNGEQRTVEAAPETPLLYVLRNELGLNTPHFGCGLAQYGACTVHATARRPGRARSRSGGGRDQGDDREAAPPFPQTAALYHHIRQAPVAKREVPVAAGEIGAAPLAVVNAVAARAR